jgi:hypothetical protein
VTRCKACSANTASVKDGDSCNYCPTDQIPSESRSSCEECSEDEYAFPGNSTCTKRSACTNNDYFARYEPCSNSQRKQVFEWITPKFCAGGVSLPENRTVECSRCEGGYYNKEGTCFQCPEGTYRGDNELNDAECHKCAAGTAPQIGNSTRPDISDKNIFSTACVSDSSLINNCATDGWKLSATALYSGDLHYGFINYYCL